MKIIILAGGCFWGLQAYMAQVPGITKTEVGYANGHTTEPTYEDVCNNTTGYAEVCKIYYEEAKVPLLKILKYFWRVIDPTALNRQGMDIGSQYRTGVYYVDSEDEQVIRMFMKQEQEKLTQPIVTEVLPLTSYTKAEAYHQEYLKKNPRGYCHIDLSSFEIL